MTLLREYGEYVLLILFVPVDAVLSMIELLKGIIDQTHYHYDAIKEHIGIILKIFSEYMGSIPRNFKAHLHHHRYLRSLGFQGNHTLSDTGKLVWDQEDKLNGNDSKLISVTGILNNSSGNHRHLSIASLALEKMWFFLSNHTDFNFADSIFVDFGCGTGLAVLAALTYPFQKVIGVELDKTSASIAQTNIDTFFNKKSKLTRCADVSILCQDMSIFEFSSIGCTTAKNSSHLPVIIFYMYEPLWTLKKEDALEIYRSILNKAKKIGRKIIVMYFYAGVYSGDALPVFQELQSKLLFKEKYHSLFFGPAEDLYIYDL